MFNLGRNRYLSGVAFTVAAIVISEPAQAQVRNFNIPAGSASQTIPLFGKQAGVQILARGQAVVGKRTNGVVGDYAVPEALRLFLEGTGLVATPARNGVITINSAGSSAVAETSEISPSDEASSQTESDKTIVVTGTSLRGTRPTSPVITITRKDIEASGSTSVEQLLRKLPQNSQSGVNNETFGSNGGGDPSEHGAGLNLRGLGQRATLVLLNGRRMAPSGGGSYVDVSMIPLTAIERVEVLTDGASAIYGSDAVGGVVNFILRKDFDGAETLVQAGTATNGDGDQLQLAQTVGRAWSTGHAMLSYEFRLEDEIKNKDRDFTINFNPNGFFLPRERKHSILAVAEQELADGLTAEVTGSYAHRTTRRDYYQAGSPLAVSVDQKADAINLSGEIRYEIGGNWLLRADGLFSRSKTFQIQNQPGGQEIINERSVTSNLWDGGLRADGTVVELPGGPLKLAVGAEIRHEDHDDLFGSSAVPDLLQQNKRSVWALYGELSVPLVSRDNRLPGVERLQISAAGRYEKYSDFGSTFDPKLGVLWAPLAGVNLRGSYGTSFRAPLLNESIDRYNVIYVPAFFLYRDPSQANGVGLFLQGNNSALGPEKARTWNLGGDLKPFKGLTFSVNWYSIRFSDRIAFPSNVINVVGDPAFDSIVIRNPALGQVEDLVNGSDFILDFAFLGRPAIPGDVTVVVDDRVNNTAVTKTSGLDFLLNYQFAVGEHQFLLEGNVSHIIDYKDQLTAASPAISVLDTPYHVLDWRGRVGLAWSYRGWSANLFANYTHGYRDNRTPDVGQVRSNTTFDLALAREFGNGSWLRGTRLALYVENLFDRDPPFLRPDPGFTTGVGYDPVNSSGRGRVIAAQLRKVW